MGEDLHGYGRKLQRALERLPERDIHPADQGAIRAFHEDCFAQGLSTARVEKYLRHLTTLGQWIDVPFHKAREADIKQLLRRIRTSEYADWTKHDLRLALKRFCRWLKDDGRIALDVDWIRVGSATAKPRLPNDMPTAADVKKMVAATASARNKAFIMLLYETGARIGEIARLRLRDLVAHEHGLEIHLPAEGKTGARRVLAVAATPYVQTWVNAHPQAHRPSAFLWSCRASGKPPGYAALRKVLRDAARAAGISKKVNPHNFRHSRATYLANHLTEAQMNQFFGWVQGSDMPSTYVHLSGRDVDAALLQTYGIETRDDDHRSKDLSPRHCTRCNADNPATHAYCGVCGLPLDEQAARQTVKRDLDRRHADAIMDRLVRDEQFRAILDKKLAELSRAGR